ncbi:MAG: DNA polymerase IV [Bacteroidetes bacterium]|nr:DNA polymerase IV [Bacteroidota bacterium]MDA1121716.1 DNA polymerase IV [Bacteroidota bacterium]
MSIRKIIHIDMDAFFASVEQRDNPDLRGKPVAVGGSSQRGVVAAASYEARKFGVHSAMPSVTAFKRCPEIIFVKPHFEVYTAVSKQIRTIFHEYTDLVEPLSLDEAYLDVTSNKKGMPSATLIAKEIRQRIKTETQLTASAGISINKFLAKIASDQDKPDGLFLIPPEKAEAFVETLPIHKFHGIGKVTTKKMHDMGINSGADLKQWELSKLMKIFGKSGRYYYNIARAIDERNVEPNRPRKSIAAENTFETDLATFDEMMVELEEIGEVVFNRMKKVEGVGRTLTLKLKYSDFKQITRSKTLVNNFDNLKLILEITRELLLQCDIEINPVRLLGLSVSNLAEKDLSSGDQLTLEF